MGENIKDFSLEIFIVEEPLYKLLYSTTNEKAIHRMCNFKEL